MTVSRAICKILRGDMAVRNDQAIDSFSWDSYVASFAIQMQEPEFSNVAVGGDATILPEDFVIVPSALAMNNNFYKRQKGAKTRHGDQKGYQQHRSLDQSSEFLLHESTAAIMK